MSTPRKGNPLLIPFHILGILLGRILASNTYDHLTPSGCKGLLEILWAEEDQGGLEAVAGTCPDLSRYLAFKASCSLKAGLDGDIRAVSDVANGDIDESFDYASALYWHCADSHAGQGSERYSILSTLGYNPGALERYPAEGLALDVYSALEASRIGEIPSLPTWEVDHIITDGLGWGGGRKEAHLFSFGACAPTRILYFSNSDDVSDGLEACAAYCAEKGFVGYFSPPDYPLSEDGSCTVCGSTQDGEMCEHFQDAEVDHTYTESGWILSWEWMVITVDYLEASRLAAERTSHGAMRPEVVGPGEYFWEVDGEGLYPSSHFSLDDVVKETGCDLEDISPSVGIHYRLSMPGYLDATEWTHFGDWGSLFEAIVEEGEDLEAC